MPLRVQKQIRLFVVSKLNPQISPGLDIWTTKGSSKLFAKFSTMEPEGTALPRRRLDATQKNIHFECRSKARREVRRPDGPKAGKGWLHDCLRRWAASSGS